MTAIITKEAEEEGCIPASYIIRIYDGYVGDAPGDCDNPVIGYDSNTINLRAATEFIAMVARKHAVEAEEIRFADGCYDLELSWRAYNELR